MRCLPCVCLVALLAITIGCRAQKDFDRPPDDTIFLASPSEDTDGGTGSAERQAVCATDTVVYDDVLALIDQYNETISDRIDALKLVLRAGARQLEREGEFEITAEGERGTITLVAVQDENDNTQFGASFTPTDGEPIAFLSGDMAASLTSGSWTLLRANGDTAVEAEWTRDLERDNVTVSRKVFGAFGERTSFYARDATTASIDFAGPQHQATVTWDRETKDGSITITDIGRADAEGTFCWDADIEARDFCSVTCP